VRCLFFGERGRGPSGEGSCGFKKKAAAHPSDYRKTKKVQKRCRIDTKSMVIFIYQVDKNHQAEVLKKYVFKYSALTPDLMGEAWEPPIPMPSLINKRELIEWRKWFV